MPTLRRILPAATLLLTLSSLAQQPGRTLTDADYRLAESRLSYSVNPLVFHTVARPAFVDGNRLLFRDASPAAGASPAHDTYVLADPASKTVSPAFDHAALANAIHTAVPEPPVDPQHLQLTGLALEDFDNAGHPRAATFTFAGKSLRCTLTPPASVTGAGAATCALDATTKDQPGNRRARAAAVTSPDGARAAFLRDWNLWLRDTKTGAETQLTHDGIPDFGYATDNAGWTHSANPILVWSPDSKRIATFQQDQRKTGMMYLVPVTGTHPKLEAWRYPLVGDKDVTLIERVTIDVPSGNVVRFKMPPDQHRSTICDDVSCSGGWDDVQWAPDSRSLAFVSTSRDHKNAWLRVADPATGAVRDVFHEAAPKFFESGDGLVNWHYLPESNEFLWFSERSGWGEMYLYDLKSGALKNQITTGDGNVTQVLSVDRPGRRILYLAVGKNPGEDPYFANLYATDLSGKNTRRLTPDNTDHSITLSPDGSLFVDIASAPTIPQVTTLRETKAGKPVLPLATQDVSALRATGWKPLTPITVKARDGKTDLFGYMFKPTALDPAKKYPVIDYIYPGPQVGSCGGGRGFSAAHGDDQALAELGFVVVCIDGIGTNLRSKSFHEGVYTTDAADNTIPDQITGIQQLAARYPFLDLDRVGIWGHSGGGNATATAMLRYPDFFKVGISESGNHDQRVYEDDWAEKWGGLEHKLPDGASSYEAQANQNYAKNLKGHLLLAHGTMDDNVPLNNTLLLVDALIKANKDFDLILIPNAHHGYGEASPYMMRRRWDYFTRYLAGNTPPHEYTMKPYAEAQRQALGPDAGISDTNDPTP